MLGSRGSKSGRGGKDGGNRTVQEEPFPQEDDGEAACRDDGEPKVWLNIENQKYYLDFVQVKQDIDADVNEGCLSISLEFRFGVEINQFVHLEFSAQEV